MAGLSTMFAYMAKNSIRYAKHAKLLSKFHGKAPQKMARELKRRSMKMRKIYIAMLSLVFGGMLAAGVGGAVGSTSSKNGTLLGAIPGLLAIIAGASTNAVALGMDQHYMKKAFHEAQAWDKKRKKARKKKQQLEQLAAQSASMPLRSNRDKSQDSE